MRIEILPEAEYQLEALDAWWREHRPAAGNQVVLEFEIAIKLLSTTPAIGAPWLHADREHLRWMRIRKTPYLVVYEYVPDSDLVSIVSVWSAMRQQPPPI